MENSKERPRNPEEELLDAARNHPFLVTSGDQCVDPEVLRSLAEGSIKNEETRNKILSHLGGCPSCLATLKRFRKAPTARVNGKAVWRSRSVRLAIALLATISLTMILWLWPVRVPWLKPRTEAVLDLRDASLTRSVDNPATTISMDATDLRIILPPEMPPGIYEVALFIRANQPAVLRTSGVANSSGSGADLFVQVQFRGLASGKYILGLKNGSSEWRYYLVTLKKK